ncbi:DNA-binding protein [Pelistega indica]|uniref:DNA-binding protein n=2 Tax=Pelistega indica TaxID=1414851 RepID=V8G7V3_9BURK|nr:DNA-binding protein [Pelistega indica]ETD72470.1 DNA-binding protein [Pelistega indica]
MYTIVESEIFKGKVGKIWTEEERLEFFTYLSQNPLMGDVIKGAQGLRKIRWQTPGRGKRGGARVIYFNVFDDGFILVLDVYVKNEQENLSKKDLKLLSERKNA